MSVGGVPWYIDQDAEHSPRTARFLAYMASRGQQGVLEPDDFKVSAGSTPGAFVNVSPGGFVVKNSAPAGAYESYADKWDSQITLPVSPTPGATRTDLVIIRVDNPYAGGIGTAGGGSWSVPVDPVNGPYWQAWVIEGVTPTYAVDISDWQPTWSAITLARIRRTNSSIVTAADIVDLRSLVDLSGERIIYIENPAPEPPPIATTLWSDSHHCNGFSTFSYSQTNWTYWPTYADFANVPIPSWAVEADMIGSFNPQYTNDIWGECRYVWRVNNVDYYGPATMFDENVSWGQSNSPGPQQVTIPMSGTISIPSAARGKTARIRMQVRMLDPSNHSGNLGTRNGVYANLFINFKRYPN